jgi:hypothetical protein
MYPPINLAKENEGELRKPTANAIPDGRYLMYLPKGEFGDMRVGKALIPDIKAKNAPKAIMKGTTCEGSVPVFSNRARLSLAVRGEQRTGGCKTHQTPADGTANCGPGIWYTEV